MQKSIIDLIYTAAIDDSALSDLASAIVTHLGGEACWLRLMGQGETTTLFGHELRKVSALNAPQGLSAGGIENIRRPTRISSFHRQRCSAADVHCLSAEFLVDEGHYAFCVHRARESPPFVMTEQRRLQDLLPHLKRALATRSRLRTQGRRIEQLETLLGRTHPLFLVTDRLEVRWMAQNTFSPLESICLAERGRSVVLGATAPDLQARLVRAVARATQDENPQSDIIETSGWIAFVDQYRSSESHQLATIRFIDKREHQRRVIALAQQRHDLTRAETALCVSLIDGKSLQEHADGHGVQISTVRSHLKTLLAKTGTNRQGELVALLARYSAATH
ncbi:helix-turn-helix transcriptional regulator [Sphingobium sp. CFD-2]|uniref:helix-turn-helix transcriptional regulator n=1 Tax=Sphingobium sp. CFD-2 TaxID=2878542 RepID=UPI00214B15DE|nr:helix-turn-helix transcriptional regulator [Sphingobium sp. CFD-2]